MGSKMRLGPVPVLLLLWLSVWCPGLRALEALSPAQRYMCQELTPDPLTGCPPGTLLVNPSAYDSNRTRNGTVFSTIQSAILYLVEVSKDSTSSSTPAWGEFHDDAESAYTILITPGTYTEQLNITFSRPLTLLGQTSSPNSVRNNDVQVLWSSATAGITNLTMDNAMTSVLTIAPTLPASLTGSGPTGFPVPSSTPPGNLNFRAYNINFTNAYRPFSAGPSLALSTGRSNSSFYDCAFMSYQDTIYVGKLAQTYMHRCVIGGQTDFLYGFGTLWVENSTLLLRGCGGGITAWKGANTSLLNTYGAYVNGSAVKAENETVSANWKGKCSLGRPWNDLHRSIFSETWLGGEVRKEGYTVWGKSDPRVGRGTLMAEYENFGPGWNPQGRKDGGVGKVLSREEWVGVWDGPDRVFTGGTDWIDWDTVREGGGRG